MRFLKQITPYFSFVYSSGQQSIPSTCSIPNLWNNKFDITMIAQCSMGLKSAVTITIPVLPVSWNLFKMS